MSCYQNERANLLVWYRYCLFNNLSYNSGVIMKRCIDIGCAQKPKLRPTGWSSPNQEWYCPVCKTKYYVDKEGDLTKDKPFKWPDPVKGKKEVIWKAPGA